MQSGSSQSAEIDAERGALPFGVSNSELFYTLFVITLVPEQLLKERSLCCICFSNKEIILPQQSQFVIYSFFYFSSFSLMCDIRMQAIYYFLDEAISWRLLSATKLSV